MKILEDSEGKARMTIIVLESQQEGRDFADGIDQLLHGKKPLNKRSRSYKLLDRLRDYLAVY